MNLVQCFGVVTGSLTTAVTFLATRLPEPLASAYLPEIRLLLSASEVSLWVFLDVIALQADKLLKPELGQGLTFARVLPADPSQILSASVFYDNISLHQTHTGLG